MSEKKTLVERLRERAAALRPWRDSHLFYNIHDAIIDEEAADRIEKLEAALRPFAERANAYDGVPPPKYFGDTDFEMRYRDDAPANVTTVGQLRAARAALTPSPLPQQP